MSRGAAARAKGNRAEVALAGWFREHGWPDARTTRDGRGGAQGGADIRGVPGWSIEVKHHATPRIAQWWEQTIDDTPDGDQPMLVWHQPGVADPGDWVCVLDSSRADQTGVRAGNVVTPGADYPSFARLTEPVHDVLNGRFVAVMSVQGWELRQ